LAKFRPPGIPEYPEGTDIHTAGDITFREIGSKPPSESQPADAQVQSADPWRIASQHTSLRSLPMDTAITDKLASLDRSEVKLAMLKRFFLSGSGGRDQGHY
jgi:hypothetical protein